MNNTSSILRNTIRCLSAAFCLLAPAIAMAKDEPAGAPQPSGFFLSYVFVILCIVLGVIAVVRPTKRMEDDRDS